MTVSFFRTTSWSSIEPWIVCVRSNIVILKDFKTLGLTGKKRYNEVLGYFQYYRFPPECIRSSLETILTCFDYQNLLNSIFRILAVYLVMFYTSVVATYTSQNVDWILVRTIGRDGRYLGPGTVVLNVVLHTYINTSFDTSSVWPSRSKPEGPR